MKYLLPAYELIVSKLTPEQIQIVYSEAAMIAAKKKAQLPVDYAYLAIKNGIVDRRPSPGHATSDLAGLVEAQGTILQ